MKFYAANLASYLRSRGGKRNVRILFRYVLVFVGMVLLFSLIFHALMEREGQYHSWLTGVYWTLTVMSTLGFGDITFHTDLGRLFSVVVLLSGMSFLLVMLPFTFIEFFYSPWIKAESESRAPRELPEGTRDHMILTDYGPVTAALIAKLDHYKVPYALVVRELEQALHLHDLGLNVVIGAPDNPETYQRLRIRDAALVATTSNDVINTNIAFTVRDIAPNIPIIATANSDSAQEILKLAGSSKVLRLDEMMGSSLARRTIGGDARAHVIGRFGQLLIAEATAAGTPLIGKTLAESSLREMVGVTVVGVWERGRFETPRPETRIGPNTVLVLSGSQDQLHAYDELFCIYHIASGPVIIVGGGRVGLATSKALAARHVDYLIVEQNPANVHQRGKYLVGNAAAIETLEQAGIREAPALIITTNDDDTNVYLTILARRLRQDIQIISRANHEINVSTLHRAGADFVMSYASMGANVIFNLLRKADVLMLAEGLNVFRVPVPGALAHCAIADTKVRPQTGCSIIAVAHHDQLTINPPPDFQLPPDADIVLIGSVENENKFQQLYGAK